MWRRQIYSAKSASSDRRVKLTLCQIQGPAIQFTKHHSLVSFENLCTDSHGIDTDNRDRQKMVSCFVQVKLSCYSIGVSFQIVFPWVNNEWSKDVMGHVVRGQYLSSDIQEKKTDGIHLKRSRSKCWHYPHQNCHLWASWSLDLCLFAKWRRWLWGLFLRKAV